MGKKGALVKAKAQQMVSACKKVKPSWSSSGFARFRHCALCTCVREAYQCFLEATQIMPTKQLAWFNLGIAASELWEAEGMETG